MSFIFIVTLLLSYKSRGQIPNDYSISGYPVQRHVLEAYLSRNLHANLVTPMPQFSIHSPFAAHSQANFLADPDVINALELVDNTRPKLISLGDGSYYYDANYVYPGMSDWHWDHVEWIAEAIHNLDEDIIIEAALYEHIYNFEWGAWNFQIGDDPDERYVIDAWANEILAEYPNFDLANDNIAIEPDLMTYPELADARSKGLLSWNVTYNLYLPDLSRLETRIYWYWRMCEYIRRGYESFHMGRVDLTLKRDCDNLLVADLLQKVRDFGSSIDPNTNQTYARRGVVFFNASGIENDYQEYIPGCISTPFSSPPPGAPIDNVLLTDPFKYFAKKQVNYYGPEHEKNILWDWGSSVMCIVEDLSLATTLPPWGNGANPPDVIPSFADLNKVKIMAYDDPQFIAEGHGIEHVAYGRTVGGIHPQGWKCDHLPHSVGWDNAGLGFGGTMANPEPLYFRNWNYTYNMDDRTWFQSLLNPQDRNAFLEYAYNKVKCLDRSAFFVMPGIWRNTVVLDHNSTPQNPVFVNYQQTFASQSYARTFLANDPALGLDPTIRNIWDAVGFQPDRNERFDNVNRRDGSVYPTFSWEEKVYIGDFNKDGKDDVLTTANNDPGVGVSWDGYQVHEAIDDGDDFEPRPVYWDASPCGAPWPYLSWGEEFYAGDFDGDGYKNEVAVLPNKALGIACPNEIRFYNSTTTVQGGKNVFTGFQYSSNFASISWDEKVYVGDFNGDGKDDLLTTPDLSIQGGSASYSGFKVYLNTSVGTTYSFGPATNYPSLCGTGCTSWAEEFYIGDFNGDGKDDFFAVSDKSQVGTPWLGVDLYTSTGSGFTYQGNMTCSGGGCYPSWGEHFYVGDFDGDGKDDFMTTADMSIGIFSYGYRIYMNKSSGFLYQFQDKGAHALNAQCAFPSWGERFHVGDYNGDGNKDFVVTARMDLNIDWNGWQMFWSKGSLGSWRPGKGNSTLDVEEGMHMFKKENSISIYPNPTNGSFTVELPQKGNYEVQIMNMMGATVHKVNLEDQQKTTIQLDNRLPVGNYMIQINGSGLQHVQKITLMR